MIFIFFLIFQFCANSQSLKEIETIKKNYQLCLDSGLAMYNCTAVYYTEIDSCLNVVYKKLLEQLNEQSAKMLMKEEIKWLKKRDNYFALIEKTNKMEGSDGRMIRLNDKAEFVMKRLEELVIRYSALK